MPFDRTLFFDAVRPMFGSLTQQQVDGLNFKLDTWEMSYEGFDLRWLANPLAQAKWETSSTMWPVSEYGKGSGQPYGQKDPETGQAYYGRGDIQLTWRENYARADKELGLTGAASCEWHADNALDPATSAAILFKGMMEGWFRSPNKLDKFFNATTNDVFNAREIVNGDKNYTKDWAGGQKVGTMIAADHEYFLKALEAAYYVITPAPPLPDPDLLKRIVRVHVEYPVGVQLVVTSEEY